MKKTRILLLSIALFLLGAVPAWAGYPIDSSTFPDAVFREVIKGFDLDGDSFLIPDEFEAVREISCDDKNVKDVTGIGIFPNLTDLHLWKCPITKLDLSQNTGLEYLDVCETKLTSLDVTKTPNLKQLWAFGNSFTTLDLSKCTYLSKAVKNGIYNNDKNGGTAYSFADEASDSFIAVDKKVKMTLADGSVVGPANDADAGVSAAGQVAISETQFPNAAFRKIVKTYDTDGNGRLSTEEISAVTSIDCSGKKITSLKGIAYFTNLETLNCSSNKLTVLNVSRNTKLNSLNCSSNKLPKLDVTRNTDLETLTCSSNKLKKLDVTKNKKLSSLNCSSNALTALDLSKNKELHTLNCSSNKLTALNINKNTKLNTLYCQSNAITKLDVSKAASLRDAVLKGRKTENADYDYFQDPHYMYVTLYIYNIPSRRTVDLSHYVYVDKTVTVKAAGVTFKPSVTPDPDTKPAKNTVKTKVTYKNGNYKLSGNTAALTGVSSANVTKLTVPATVSANGKKYKVTSIAASACEGLEKLNSVSIGKNVTAIGKNAFFDCGKLKTVTGGSGLTTIGESAFQGCAALAKFTIGVKVKKIGAYAFYGCENMKILIIKTKLLKESAIGNKAFGKTYGKIKVSCAAAQRKAYKTILQKRGLSKQAKF